MERTLTLGFSPCPNDTFIFYALVNGRLDTGGLAFRERVEDVETLNRLAIEGALDVTKVSCGAFGSLRDGYRLLRSGGALGRGCGPLVVARKACRLEDLRGRPIAVPGLNTTAHLLLRLHDPALGQNVLVMPFHEIMDAVRDGKAEAGLIIHESRFTYPDYGLMEVEDLGKWWEERTGLPIPLGGIVARRSLGKELNGRVEALVRKSVLYGMAHRDEPSGYIKKHSRELEDRVIEAHIALYVNDFSVDMGREGAMAVEALFRMAKERGIMRGSSEPIFI